jgi:hypothetical protein
VGMEQRRSGRESGGGRYISGKVHRLITVKQTDGRFINGAGVLISITDGRKNGKETNDSY